MTKTTIEVTIDTSAAVKAAKELETALRNLNHALNNLKVEAKPVSGVSADGNQQWAAAETVRNLTVGANAINGRCFNG